MFRMLIGYVTVCVLVVAGFARANIVQNISTGIDRTTGLQLPNNASDPNWSVGPGAQAGTYTGVHLIARSSPLPPPYIPDSASTASRWVAINSGQPDEGISMPQGFFSFQTTVDLTGFDPATASIPGGRFGADDEITVIRINGTIIQLPIGVLKGGFDQFYALPTNMGTGLFTSGVNTISFDMLNADAGTPMALRLEASVTATPTPEPAFASFAAIIASLTLLSRRRTA